MHLKSSLNDKAGRCIAFMKKRKFQEDLCDLEIKRLRGEIKAVEAEKKSYNRDRLGIGDWLMGWMQKVGVKKIESGMHRASIGKKRTSVEVVDEGAITTNFMKQNVKYVPDKTAIKKHFEETGEEIDGVKVHFGETHLLVRYGKLEESDGKYV